MSRIVLPDPEKMTPEQRRQYDRFPSNLARALVMTTPDLASHVLSIGVALRSAPLDAKLRELVILRVAKLSSSAYETMQHFDVAKDVGWTVDEIAAIEAGKTGSFDQRTSAVLQFTDECFTKHSVSDNTFRDIRGVLTESEIATLALLIGQYALTAIFVNTIKLDLDSQPTSWAALTS